MLDLAEAHAALDAARIGNARSVSVSPRWLKQAIAEIEGGRRERKLKIELLPAPVEPGQIIPILVERRRS